MSDLQITALVIAVLVAIYAAALLQIQKRGRSKGTAFYFSLLFVFLLLTGISYFFLVHMTSGCKGMFCNLEEVMIWFVFTGLLIIAFPVIVFIKASGYSPENTTEKITEEPEEIS